MLADNSSYSFKYNSYGEVTTVMLPTGGSYRYRLPKAQGCAANTGSGVIPANSYLGYIISRRLAERDELPDGVTISARAIYPPPAFGNADNYHGDRRTTAAEVDYQDAGGTLLRKEQHYFYGDTTSSSSIPASPTDNLAGRTESNIRLS